MPNTNRGVRVRPRQPTDYIAGASPIPFTIVNPAGDWRPYEVTPKPQHSDVQDFMDCVSESMTHDIEMQIKRYTGQDVDLSERFVAKMSGTTLEGNYQTVVADAIRKYGIPLESDWPHTGPQSTWDEFYAEIPQSVKDKALNFLKDWNFQYEFVNAVDVPKHLTQAPLQIIIEQVHPYHAQALVTSSIVMDSYGPPFDKPLKSVYDYLKPLITPRLMNQTKLVLGKDGHTVYKATPVATTFDDLVKQCAVEGIEVPSPIPPASSL